MASNIAGYENHLAIAAAVNQKTGETLAAAQKKLGADILTNGAGSIPSNIRKSSAYVNLSPAGRDKFAKVFACMLFQGGADVGSIAAKAMKKTLISEYGTLIANEAERDRFKGIALGSPDTTDLARIEQDVKDAKQAAAAGVVPESAAKFTSRDAVPLELQKMSVLENARNLAISHGVEVDDDNAAAMMDPMSSDLGFPQFFRQYLKSTQQIWYNRRHQKDGQYMAEKLSVKKPRKAATGRVALVATYKGDQLTKWRGWYNYPISDEDFAATNAKVSPERSEPQSGLNAGCAKNGRARTPVAPQTPADGNADASASLSTFQPFNLSTFQRINELWLFKGTKDERRYRAEFVGVKTREELIRDYGYPGGGVSAAKNAKDAKNGRAGAPRTPKPHGTHYALFKTEILYRHKNDLPGEADAVIVRVSDFAKRSPKIASQLKAYLESPDRKDPDLAKRLPEIITRLRPDQLRVCEAAVQMDFWLNTTVDDIRQSVTSICGNPSSSISFRNEYGTLYLGDSLTWLRGLPTASVDLIFADPPYSIGKAEWDMFYSHEEYLLWCEKWIGECSRILTDKGTCYICGFSEILSDVKYRTQHFFNGCRWIVWHYRNKANLGMDWGRSHESLLHFRKGRKTVLNVDDIRIPYSAHTLKYPVHPQADSSAYGKGRSNSSAAQWRPNEKGAKPKDVFDIPTTCNGMGEKTPHPTQKPEELVRKLVLASSREGDLVVDPFSGSGTTAVVAQQLHRRWLACDRNKEYNQWAIQRLEHVPDHPIQYWIEFDREVSKRRESIR